MSKRHLNPDWIAEVKKLPCCACGRMPPSEAHHLREKTGLAQRESDHGAVPLCSECHRFYHARRDEFRRRHGSDLELLIPVLDTLIPQLLYPPSPDEEPF